MDGVGESTIGWVVLCDPVRMGTKIALVASRNHVCGRSLSFVSAAPLCCASAVTACATPREAIEGSGQRV
jgi:hypothetical protein